MLHFVTSSYYLCLSTPLALSGRMAIVNGLLLRRYFDLTPANIARNYFQPIYIFPDISLLTEGSLCFDLRVSVCLSHNFGHTPLLIVMKFGMNGTKAV